MGFFQEIDEQYFVEEISYEDMLVILEQQKHQHESKQHESENLQRQSTTNQEQQPEAGTDVAEQQCVPESIPEHCATINSEQNSEQNITKAEKKAEEIARRIAENANKKLADWLLNY